MQPLSASPALLVALMASCSAVIGTYFFLLLFLLFHYLFNFSPPPFLSPASHLLNCSCNGSLPYISAVPALWAVLMYMTANILYNIFLILVIKYPLLLSFFFFFSSYYNLFFWFWVNDLTSLIYGSAALMYIASTLVLPLGSISFTIHAFLGHNTQKFTVYLFPFPLHPIFCPLFFYFSFIVLFSLYPFDLSKV